MAADSTLSPADTGTDQDFWPSLFRRQVAANARYWTQQVADRPGDALRLHTERHNIVKALNRALQLEAAWTPALDLLLTFHPYMERRGVMAEWEQYVEASLEISRRQAIKRPRQLSWTALASSYGRASRLLEPWSSPITRWRGSTPSA